LHPFTTVAICVLPEHLHAIWQMPVDDGDYALRWRVIKSSFSRNFAANQQRSSSKI
jgi:putative transposase